MKRKAAFLDRDGVINLDHGYLHRWADFEFVPGAVDAMRRLAAAGYALVVVTNQSGIARGMYSEADYQALTASMRGFLAGEGVPLAGVYHCPHLPGGQVGALAIDCDCRKPAPGMLLRAAAELGLDLGASVLFGDKPSDVEAARRAGTGAAWRLATDGRPDGGGSAPDFVSLSEAVDRLLGPGDQPTPIAAPRRSPPR